MSWDTSRARDVSFTVRVNGTVRPIAGAPRWEQDITSDMPATVSAGGQVSQRTGSIVWARERAAETRTPSPWYQGPHWIPTVGDAVTIDAHDGKGNTHRVFTGVIDTIEGDAHGNRSSKIVAPINGANRVIRRLALTREGALPGGEVGYLATTPVWVVSEIARELGYSSVPPAPAAHKLILDAPLQGSTYNYSRTPYVNAQLVKSSRMSSTTLAPVWFSYRDGFGLSDANLEWVPNTGGGTGAGSVGVSFLTYFAHSGDATVTVEHGDDAVIVKVTGDEIIRTYTRVGGTLVSRTPAATFPQGKDGPHRVSVVFRDGSISTRINGVEETLAAATPQGVVTRIRLEAQSSACVAGLQVWQPSSLTDHHAPTWAPTAAYRYGTGTHSTILAPSIRDEKAGDVLQDYADALLSPVWIDGRGVLQIVTGKALHDQSPSLTVDALRDISELSYRMDLLDYRPTVEVSYAHASQSTLTATEAKTTVWQGNGGEVSWDAPDETFVNIPDDEEWIGLSDPAAGLRLTSTTVADFNTGTRTWWGLAQEDSVNTDELVAITGGEQLVEALTPWSWKLTTKFAGAGGAAQQAPTSTTVKARYREMDMPVWRARARVKYDDRTVAVTGSGAAPDGVLSHDAGKWITTTTAATDLAQWLHSMVGTPTPVLEGMRVHFDPRLEVGIKITVKAQAVFGADFEALVLSVDHDPETMTTTVTARVTKVTTYAETLDDVDYAYIGQSLTYWDQARTGRTLDDVAANPKI